MDGLDESTQRMVWQRVFARAGEQPRDDLQKLILQAMESAAAYRLLAGTLAGGQSRELAKRLYGGAQETVDCLNGVRLLAGERVGKPKALPMPREPAEKVLEKCYHRSRRAMAEYTARSAEPEFGAVFRSLAQREEAHCVLIAQLLGKQTVLIP